jgi:RNA polymerase sigma-70 factor (ECF subfamily)
VASWLSAIALNLVRDHFRAQAREPDALADDQALDEVPFDGADVEQALLQAEMSACIGEFLARLPRPQDEVVALHDMAGLRHREVAALLDLTTANARVLLHRGRAALRRIMEDDCVLSFDDDTIPCERRPPPGTGS